MRKPNLESLALIASNVFDATTTVVGLENKILNEANPVMSHVYDASGWVGMYGIKGLGVAAVLYFYNKNPTRFGKNFLYGASLFYTAVGLANLYFMWQNK